MTLETYTALILYAVVASLTPGPNNLMLLASGVNFGFRRTIPHMLGIGAGFFLLLMGVGFGLGTLLAAFPAVHTALKFAGGAYLVYLAWKIASTRVLSSSNEPGTRPMTFLAAVAFQWVNPKAWVMAVTAMAIYTDPQAFYKSVFLIGIVFAFVNVPCVSAWAAFGVALRSLLADPERLKWFNITMGLLLVASLWPMLR